MYFSFTESATLAAAGTQPLRVDYVILIGLLFLGGLLLLGLWLWQSLRAKRRALDSRSLSPTPTSMSTSMEVASLRPPGKLVRDRLSAIYQRFLQQLSPSAQEAVSELPWILVLGDIGVGKSQLISRISDWQRQHERGHKSLTDDALLQVYLGSRLVVHELAASVLVDSSQATERALRKLWAPLCRQRPPLVLVLLNQVTLQKFSPTHRLRLGQCIQHKLRLLSNLSLAPVRANICATYLDEITGFSEYIDLAQQQLLPAWLPVRRRHDPHPSLLVEGLTRNTQRLSLSLIHQGAAEFRSLVAFMAESQQKLAPIDECIRSILAQDLFSYTAHIERIYLSGASLADKLSRPFSDGQLQPLPVKARRTITPPLTPLQQPSLGAPVFVFCTVALLVTFGGLWMRSHFRLLHSTREAVGALTSAVAHAQSDDAAAAKATIQAVQPLARTARDSLHVLSHSRQEYALISRFLPNQGAQLEREYLVALRRAYVVPALTAPVTPETQPRSVLILASLYAQKDSRLGQALAKHPALFAAALGMPEDLFLDYVERCQTLSLPATSPPLPLPLSLPSGEGDALYQDAPWHHFLGGLEHTLAESALSPGQLLLIQQAATKLQAALHRLPAETEARRLLDLMASEGHVDTTMLFGKTAPATILPWLSTDEAALERLFSLLAEVPESRSPSGTERSETIRLSVGGRVYQLAMERWLPLLRAKTAAAPEAAPSDEPKPHRRHRRDKTER